jgi:predicted metalloendopeptidase
VDVDQKLDKLSEKIDAKFDKIIETANRQEVHLGELTVSVTEHVKRSNMMEDEQKDIKKELEPIKRHVAIINALGKGIGLIIAGGGLGELIHFIMRHS